MSGRAPLAIFFAAFFAGGREVRFVLVRGAPFAFGRRVALLAPAGARADLFFAPVFAFTLTLPDAAFFRDPRDPAVEEALLVFDAPLRRRAPTPSRECRMIDFRFDFAAFRAGRRLFFFIWSPLRRAS